MASEMVAAGEGALTRGQDPARFFKVKVHRQLSVVSHDGARTPALPG